MAGSAARRLCWCLKRRGGGRDWLLLEEGCEVTIGRGLGLTYQLLSKRCPLMISRVHCIFRQNEPGQWSVTDNKSLNGVYLNKERLEPSKAYRIWAGDYIQLGVPLEDGERAEYEYELIQEERETIEPYLIDQTKGQRPKRKYSVCESDASGAEGSSNSKSKVLRVSKEGDERSRSSQRTELAKQATEKVESKLPVPGPSTLDAEEFDSSFVSHGTQAFEKAGPHGKVKNSVPLTPSRSTVELSKVRETMQEIRKLKLRVQEKQTAVLSIKHQSKKHAQKEILDMESELQELHDQLRTEQEQQLQRVMQLEKTFYEEEQQLEGVQNPQADESLKEQLAQALQEHTLLMEELNRSKKDFEQIIQAKNKELQESMEEKEKVRAQKEEVLNQMNDVLENELQCIICSEHFIEAVTLNCSHSFCSYCIKEWIKRKVECPICRQEIVTQTRSLVLDNCIERMVDSLSLEMKQHRLSLIRERKEKREAAVSPAKSDRASSPLSTSSSIMSISSFNSEDYEASLAAYEDDYDDDDDDDDSFFVI